MAKIKEHDSEQLVLAILGITGQKNYRPLKPRQIAKRLRLPKDRAAEFKRTIKQMVRRGLLVYGANHLLGAGVSAGGATVDNEPAEKASKKIADEATNQKEDKTVEKTTKRELKSKTLTKAEKKSQQKMAAMLRGNRVVGVFRRSGRGFGFVRPKDVGATLKVVPPTGKPKAEIEDVYIPAKRTGDAASGDLVLVQLLGPRKQGHKVDKKTGDKGLGPRGEIVKVLDRQTRRFVGTYQESAGSAFVMVDGSIFAEPIYVGDPGAKGVRPDDKVVFEMVRFPSAFREGEGVIVEVLGPRGRPGIDTLSIIRQFDLPDEFAADAIEEAHRCAELQDESVPQDRLDLTGETVITIDPADARDFDDAISLEKLENGHWRLGVHIADVSHFVRPGTALDREAVHRGTSVYLPDRVIPMLPELISNSLASLQPGKVRFTKSVFIEFTTDGLRVDTAFDSAAIKSSRRLNYEEVDEFLADGKANHEAEWRDKLGEDVYGLLGRMYELSRVLRKRRFQLGALELSLPEVKIDLDKNGDVAGAHEAVNTESHQIIEEFMLAANEAVAEALRDKKLFFLRRIHAQPSPRKLKALTEYVKELGIETDSLESRFALQKVLDAAVGRDDEQAIMFAVLRSMQQAVYGPEEEGHYALASDCYCHFTSPIRRYPDLTVHRLLGSIIRKEPPRNDYGELVALGELCSNRERRAESAERELVKLKLLDYMSSRIGQKFDVVVTGVERFGLFVRGIDLPAEGLIRLELLADDNYFFDRAAHLLMGHRTGNTFRLGDRLRAEVARVDLERRELDFRPAGRINGGGDGKVKDRKQVQNRSKRTIKKRKKRRRR